MKPFVEHNIPNGIDLVSVLRETGPKARMGILVQGTLEIETEYPAAVKYPFVWASERQRRAYFATNGFGGGIPYRRTNAVRDAWEDLDEIIADGIAFNLKNSSPAAQWVNGRTQQQPGHIASGHKNISAIAAVTFGAYVNAVRAMVGPEIARYISANGGI